MVQDSVPPETVDVEVSIVTLGDRDRLAACVATLEAACAGLSWRLTVVDNAPRELDLATLAGASSTEVVRSEGRRGFGANHNLVLSPRIDDGRARYVLVLNDDTELDPNSVTALVRYADSHSDIGLVGPRVRDSAGREDDSYVAWPSLWEQAAHAAIPRLARSLSRSSGWLMGSCLLLRTAALRAVGPFDPAFFLFFEDTDLCLRMARGGWRLGLCRDATLVHHAHQTISLVNRDAQMERQFLRSQYLYFDKHHGRTAARSLTCLVRAAMVARTAKMLVEAAAPGERASAADARTLWKLARYRPTEPTMLESQAAGAATGRD